VYDEDYVDEDEPMDPPSPFQRPKPSGFEKKSSPPPVLSYPKAFEGAHLNLKATPPSLLQNQKFKIPDPKMPVYIPPATKPITTDVKPVVQDDIPGKKPTPPVKRNVTNFVTLPPKDEVTTTKRPTPRPSVKPVHLRKGVNQKRPTASPLIVKKIRPASSIVNPKYTHHPSFPNYPSHTLASYAQNPPTSSFSHGPPTESFPFGPPTSPFNHGPPNSPFNQGPPTSHFNHGPSTASYPQFLPTVEPTYQMVPAAQQEYNFASIGGVGLLSGGSVVAGQLGEDESGESREEEESPFGQQYKQVSTLTQRFKSALYAYVNSFN